MNKNTILFLIIAIFLTACSSREKTGQEEAIAKTIKAIVKQELASTPSKIPPTLTPTKKPSNTITVSPTQTSTPTPEPTYTKNLQNEYPAEGYGPKDFPPNVNPLTGLPVEDAAMLDRRPISVKISNYPRGIRPQWGLSYADHVYEYYHEAGLTRFNAIFYSNDVEQFGPIRSGRLSDVDIINMYKAFFAFGSADYRVRQVLYSADFANRLSTATDYPCPPTTLHPLCRIDQEHWDHLVGSTEMMRVHFEDLGVSNERQALDGLFFDPDLPVNGQPASSILVWFSQGSYHKWEYKPYNRKYYRYEDAEVAVQGEEQFIQSTDRLNKQPLTADNLILLLAEYQYYSVDPEIVEINFTKTGRAYIFREGQVFRVNWNRSSKEDLFSFTYEDGSLFPLKPGQTWFVVIGTTSQIDEEDGDWAFDFSIP